MRKGIMKCFDNNEKYGFVTLDDGKEVIVDSHTTIENTDMLHQGQPVEIDVVHGNKGLFATTIKVI